MKNASFYKKILDVLYKNVFSGLVIIFQTIYFLTFFCFPCCSACLLSYKIIIFCNPDVYGYFIIFSKIAQVQYKRSWFIFEKNNKNTIDMWIANDYGFIWKKTCWITWKAKNNWKKIISKIIMSFEKRLFLHQRVCMLYKKCFTGLVIIFEIIYFLTFFCFACC